MRFHPSKTDAGDDRRRPRAQRAHLLAGRPPLSPRI